MSAAIAIAGAGRVGQALGRLLYERGEPVTAVASRTAQHSRAAAEFIGRGVRPLSYAELDAARVVIAVPDDALTGVAALLPMRSGLALHTCGSRGPEALRVLAERDISCATLHPLQTVATPEQGLAALQGAAFGVTGEGPAADWAKAIAALLGGEVLRIEAGARPLYHAAAAMAGNYVIGLIDAAVILMGTAGIEETQARRALGPLVRASCENALALGSVHALTGPIERGDAATIALHRHALAAAPANVRELYRAAAWYVLELARRRGLAEEKARELEELLHD